MTVIRVLGWIHSLFGWLLMDHDIPHWKKLLIPLLKALAATAQAFTYLCKCVIYYSNGVLFAWDAGMLLAIFFYLYMEEWILMNIYYVLRPKESDSEVKNIEKSLDHGTHWPWTSIFTIFWLFCPILPNKSLKSMRKGFTFNKY